MNATIAQALLDSYRETVALLITMLDKADPEDSKRLINLWIEREIWWQANFWRPFGEWIAGQSTDRPS